MRLYYFAFSPPARKALAVARHLGFQPEVRNVDLFKGEQRSPEFQKLNPFGKVPCLEDGSLKLAESDAIAQYLADKKGDTTIFPKQLEKRYEIVKWQFWAANHWSRYLGVFTFENLVKGALKMGSPDAGKLKEAEEFLKASATVLDAQLAGKRWVTGDELTLADFSILAFLMHQDAAKVPLQGFANIQRAYGALQELPCWRETAPPPMG